MFNVKNQADYNSLSWDNRLRYNAANPDSEYAKAEKKRTEEALYSAPTEQAKNWWAQQNFIAKGGNVEDAISGNFDKSAYSWQAGTPVRSGLNALSIADDRIGYKNGTVTLDGKDFLTPDAVVDGRSYASEDKIKEAFRSYNNSNQVVAARKYINAKNPAISVGWDADLGQVLVGSVPLTPDYIRDGVAYISRGRIDAALRQAQASTGLYTPQDILNDSNEKWGSRIERLYDQVENPEPFTYSAESDPLYQEFKREWKKQNQKQYDDTIASLNTQTGGAPSLGAMAAAWNMLQDSNGQLDAYKQQFRNQAYQEYMDDYNRDVARLETALGMQENEFNREYGVAADTRNNYYYDKEFQQNMELHPYTVEAARLSNEALALELEQNKQLSPYNLEIAIQQVKEGELQLTKQALQNLILQAEVYGIPFEKSPDGGSGSGKKNSGNDWETEYVETETEQTPNNTPATTPDGIYAEVRKLLGGEPGEIQPAEEDLVTAFAYVGSHSALTDVQKKKIYNAIRYAYKLSEDTLVTVLRKAGIY